MIYNIKIGGVPLNIYHYYIQFSVGRFFMSTLASISKERMNLFRFVDVNLICDLVMSVSILSQ